MKRICQSITTNNPEVHLFCLLVDERPGGSYGHGALHQGALLLLQLLDMPAESHCCLGCLLLSEQSVWLRWARTLWLFWTPLHVLLAYNLAIPGIWSVLSGGALTPQLCIHQRSSGCSSKYRERRLAHYHCVCPGRYSIPKMHEVIFEEFKALA